MFKYIKWELIAFIKKNLKFLYFVFGLYALVAILPYNNGSDMVTLIYTPFTVILMAFYVGAFIWGAKKVVDTFSKKTFLLESMISDSPYKILLSKYVLAIIINLFCIIMGMLGLLIIFYKAGEAEAFVRIFEEFFDLGFANVMKATIYLVVGSTSLTSLITLCYISAKSISPNSKGGAIGVGIIIWWVIQYFMIMFMNEITNVLGLYDAEPLDTGPFLLINLMMLGFIAVYYYITVKLIENKLEIYS